MCNCCFTLRLVLEQLFPVPFVHASEVQYHMHDTSYGTMSTADIAQQQMAGILHSTSVLFDTTIFFFSRLTEPAGPHTKVYQSNEKDD